MKIMIRFTLIIIFSVAVFSCKSKKDPGSHITYGGPDNRARPTSLNNPTMMHTDDDTYRLVVSFYSVASGIDHKAKDEFEKLLNSYPKKIAYEPTHWGREGEVDYCLKLNELSGTEQVDFVQKAKELLGKSKLTHVNENAKCVNKH